MALDAYLVHWNAPEWCRESVETLIGQGATVTVINNAGTLDLPPSVRVIDSGGNRGFAGGANLALTLAAGGTGPVLIACHDARFTPGALDALTAALDTDPGLGIVGPAINGQGGDEAALEWISGTALLLRREVAETFRFDERFSSYNEDVDLCYRVRDAGWRIGRVGTAIVTTAGSADPDRAALLMHRNTLTFFASRGMWRAFAGRVLLLLRKPTTTHLRALATGLVTAAAFRWMRPDRITRRFA